jgi:hypothetical protein
VKSRPAAVKASLSRSDDMMVAVARPGDGWRGFNGWGI